MGIKKIITAIDNPMINNFLSQYEDIKIIGKDIPYKEGIIERLEIDDVDILIINSDLPGEIELEELIDNIKTIKDNIEIIYILTEENEKTKKILEEYNVKIILKNENYQDNLLKAIIPKSINNKIIENYEKEQEYEIEVEEEYDELKEIESEISKNETNICQNRKYFKSPNQVISVTGAYNVGKSLLIINILKNCEVLGYENILILDCDFLNESIYYFLRKKNNNIKQKDYNNLEKIIKNITIKINKNIEFISGKNLFLKKTNKIYECKDLYTIKEIISILKKKYNLIILDIGTKNKFNLNEILLKDSTKIIFLLEPNLLGIKKGKEIIDKYINEYEIDKEKIKIIANKCDKYSVNNEILSCCFYGIKVIGRIKYEDIYSKIINKNTNIKKEANKKIINENKMIAKKILGG